nr:uncharacterized protein LOC112794595 [Arachis hypogaea]
MAPARSLEKYLKVEQLNLEATGFATTTLSASSISIFSRYFLQIDGEKPPESLFMKELKRMGMTPTSLLEDYKQGNSGVDEEVVVNEQDKAICMFINAYIILAIMIFLSAIDWSVMTCWSYTNL